MSYAEEPKSRHRYEDLARDHESGLVGRRRGRGIAGPGGSAARDLARSQSTRLALARMLYGGSPTR